MNVYYGRDDDCSLRTTLRRGFPRRRFRIANGVFPDVVVWSVGFFSTVDLSGRIIIARVSFHRCFHDENPTRRRPRAYPARPNPLNAKLEPTKPQAYTFLAVRNIRLVTICCWAFSRLNRSRFIHHAERTAGRPPWTVRRIRKQRSLPSRHNSIVMSNFLRF